MLYTAHGQLEDSQWLVGGGTADQLEPGVFPDTLVKGGRMDFRTDPPTIYMDSLRIWDVLTTNSSLSSPDGDLLAYTNGQALHNGSHGYIEDTINYSRHWENWVITQFGNVAYFGFIAADAAIILPIDSVRIAALYTSRDLEAMQVNSAKMIQADVVSNTVIRQETEFTTKRLAQCIGGIRHANGRDWWIIVPLFDSRNIDVFLLSDGDLSLVHSIEDLEGPSLFNSLVQFEANRDGTSFLMANVYDFDFGDAHITVYDFDRETGVVSNRRWDNAHVGSTLSHGGTFSPSGRYVYFTDSERLYQYDLEASDFAASRMVVAEYDGFQYYHVSDTAQASPSFTRFGWMSLAPDGRIYCGQTSATGRYWHVIEDPNARGPDCKVQQHILRMPTPFNRTIPHFPTYRLGPIDGSIADSLGIDNHPVPKFRYIVDDVDQLEIQFRDLSYYNPVEYFWDFGDGTTSLEVEPLHTYEDPGVYEVCLTVSNSNSDSTTCKTLYLGTVSVAEDTQGDIGLHLYPNPTVDFVSITTGSYVPLDGRVLIRDRTGRVVVKAVPIGHGSYVEIPVSKLPSGYYIAEIRDRRELVGSLPFIKVE